MLVAAMCRAYPAYKPEEVLAMRIDWALLLLEGAKELAGTAERATVTAASRPERQADGTEMTRITSMDQLRGVLRRR